MSPLPMDLASFPRPKSALSSTHDLGVYLSSEKVLPPRPGHVNGHGAPPQKMSSSAEVLPTLQVAGGDPSGLDPVEDYELEPGSFDLVPPGEGEEAPRRRYELESRSELLFSRRHLEAVFADAAQLRRFANFLHEHRPAAVPLLRYYLDALKALRAIDYSNSVLRALAPPADLDAPGGGGGGVASPMSDTVNASLQMRAYAAFDQLTRDELPMYITHVWIKTVTVSIRHRIRGTLPHASEGLAEVFCLTDPSRPDNPIVFTSDEFHRTTQYGMSYVIGRNCRFLQGPHTNPFSVDRIRARLSNGMEHYETFLNYRRDGSPFMNLLMLAPLYDSKGVIRYFIGAQVDVSGLAKQCYGLDALKQLVDEDAQRKDGQVNGAQARDEFVRLAEMLNEDELETVRRRGGHMHRPRADGGGGDEARRAPNGRCTTPTGYERGGGGGGGHGGAESSTPGGNWARERVVLQDPESPDGGNAIERPLGHGGAGPGEAMTTTAAALAARHNGRLAGVYEHYLLVRPYPSLRILFTSPRMRVPGILQSPLLDRIGGSPRMRDDFVQALAHGRGVTAKVKWINVSHGGGNQQQQRRARTKRAARGGPDAAGRHPLEAHLEPDDYGDDVDGDDGANGGEAPDPEPTAGRARWLHCTPLLGANGKVGVWMIVIVDDEAELRLRGGGGGGGPEEAAAAARAKASSPAPSSAPPRPTTTTTTSPTTTTTAVDGPPTAPPHPSYLLRPRRSSDTLGSVAASPPASDGGFGFGFPARDDSITQAIHKRHAGGGGGGLRAHLRPHPHPHPHGEGPPRHGSAGLPASFFSLAALARGARTGKPRGGVMASTQPQQQQQQQQQPPPSPAASAAALSSPSSPPHRREQTGARMPEARREGAAMRAASFYAQPPPPSSDRDATSSRVVYIPPAIDERADERSRWDTASLQSQDTVNIEG